MLHESRRNPLYQRLDIRSQTSNKTSAVSGHVYCLDEMDSCRVSVIASRSSKRSSAYPMFWLLSSRWSSVGWTCRWITAERPNTASYLLTCEPSSHLLSNYLSLWRSTALSFVYVHCTLLISVSRTSADLYLDTSSRLFTKYSLNGGIKCP